jgi:hypothetical protein
VKIALIILSGHEIDVIMGMSWMKLHKAVLDITDRLVHLSSPVYGKVTLHLPTIFLHQSFLSSRGGEEIGRDTYGSESS